MLLIPPRSPDVDGHADRTVSKELALRGKGKDIRHKHCRNLLFVDLVHLVGTIEPSDCAAGRRLGLANYQGQAIHDEYNIEALLDRANLVGPLVADCQAIVGERVGIDQANRDMLAIRAKGHRLLAAQPGHEVLVGPHQPVGLHREDAGAEVVDHLISSVRLRGDLTVEPDKCLSHP